MALKRCLVISPVNNNDVTFCENAESSPRPIFCKALGYNGMIACQARFHRTG